MDFFEEKYDAMPNFTLTVVSEIYEIGMIIKGTKYS
jgi:hypothetical protein